MTMTKTGFQDLWCEWTGEDVREVRHRLRLCSEAGVLPVRANPFSDEDIVRAVLAFLASETHIDAPRAVGEFSKFRRSASDGDGDEAIASTDLLHAILVSLRPPYSLEYLAVSPNGRWAELHVIRDGDPFTNNNYYFSGPPADQVPTTHPIIVTQSISRELTSRVSSILAPPVNPPKARRRNTPPPSSSQKKAK